MTLEQQMQMARNRALAALDNSAEYHLREAQTDLLEYYADNMQSATAKNYKKTKSGKLRALKNNTDKVYVLYGNLVRALMPKKKGNISEFAKQGQRLYSKIGIDTAVVPYAAVHEYGGGNNIPARPYFFPAIKKYVEEGFNDRLRKIVEDSIKAWG
jgi:phage gpG-like protein